MLDPYDSLRTHVNVSRETFERLEKFHALLEKWNDKINLVGKSTIINIWERHIIDSAQLINHIPSSARSLTDFGSGAGFPGIVLSLLGMAEVHLVESDSRKAAFLVEASRLSAGKVHIHNERIEALTPWKSDVITARALAPLPWLIKLCHPFLQEGTTGLFLKGAHAQQELDSAKIHWDIDAQLHRSVTNTEAWIIQINTLTRKQGAYATESSL